MQGFDEMGQYIAGWVRKRREKPGSDLLKAVIDGINALTKGIMRSCALPAPC